MKSKAKHRFRESNMLFYILQKLDLKEPFSPCGGELEYFHRNPCES
jgi:hypothetical protein